MAFPKPLPKFNLYSYAVEDNSNGKLLSPQFEALQSLQKFFETYQTGRIGLISMPTGSEARAGRIIRKTKWVEVCSDHEDLCNIFPLILERVKDIQQEKDRDNHLPDDIPHMAIAITKNITYAQQVAGIWNHHWGTDHGSAIAYHSELPKKTNLAMMQAIRSNEVKLVVVVGQLLEGFDHPPISIAAIMTKIDSPVKFAQFIGRAQRIVRGREGPESKGILAHVITHSHFQQKQNYRAFEHELLIEAD
ncbi:hypothetical protein OS493_038611 [Desmophyllum pertusum]|uniref:Uncharacterized protein n=1 Tax=Desmophyllum pertusum TaxID=174260 RepID=A0A9X0CU90_9CNID|nr:hypothetical protein OS493_038611 [Desmophyllum pertusum]